MGKESILYHGVIPGFSQWGWVVPQKRFRRLRLDRHVSRHGRSLGSLTTTPELTLCRRLSGIWAPLLWYS